MPLRTRDEQLLRSVKTKNEEPAILDLAKWLAVFVFCGVTALSAGYFAFQQLRMNWVSTEPAEVLLYELENDRPLPSSYVKISPHISMAKVRIADTYPIFSIEETALPPTMDTSPGAEIPFESNQLIYRLRKCRFLVRNRQAIKSGNEFDGEIVGMVVGRASDLEVRDGRFKQLNIREPQNVFVLDTGRKPNTIPGILLTIVFVATLIGAVYAFRPLKKSFSKFNYE